MSSSDPRELPKESPFVFGEDSFLFLSPFQTNAHLHLLIKATQKDSPFFQTVKPNGYYVLFEAENTLPTLVKGREIVAFTVVVSSAEELRKRIISEGVPSFDAHALSTEVDRTFDQETATAYERVLKYACRLSQFVVLSSVSTKDILFLCKRVRKMLANEYWKINNAPTRQERNLARVNIAEYQQQLSALSEVLGTGLR